MFRFVLLPCIVLVLPGLILSSYGLIYAIDSTGVIPKASYSDLLKKNFTRAIIRGYNPACSSTGGEVNPDFVASYNNARAAGYGANGTDIQTYWLPCNGDGNDCKEYKVQLNELLATFVNHSMDIGKIWVDLERDSDCPNNWNYGTSGNIAQAQSLLATIKNSSFNLKFGIYSSKGEWENLFGSANFTLDSSVPLWYGNINGNQTVTLDTRSSFGGWKTAAGHQYSYNRTDSVPFDESVFLSESPSAKPQSFETDKGTVVSLRKLELLRLAHTRAL